MTLASRQDLRSLLAGIQTIAIVGLSANPMRPSNRVGAFLVSRGYTCVGVNPGIAGTRVHGIAVVARLADIQSAIDMVDIFRAPDAVGGIVGEALALASVPRVVWMQLGIVDEAAKASAEAAGLTVVMDECPRIVLGG